MKNVAKIIDLFGGLDWLKGDGNYIRLEAPGYMRLVIEWVPEGIRGSLPNSGAVSVAHYGEQNGDAMRDPEVTFLVNGPTWTPIYFRNDCQMEAFFRGEIPDHAQNKRDPKSWLKEGGAS